MNRKMGFGEHQTPCHAAPFKRVKQLTNRGQSGNSDDIQTQLTQGGFTVPKPVANHGRLTFYFDAPFGVVIEVEAFLGKQGRKS